MALRRRGPRAIDVAIKTSLSELPEVGKNMLRYQSLFVLFIGLSFFQGFLAADQSSQLGALFDDRKIIDMKISPDGQHLGFTVANESEVNLAIMRLAESKIIYIARFGQQQHVTEFWWSGDERLVASVEKVTGSYQGGWTVPDDERLLAFNADGGRLVRLDDVFSGSLEVIHPLPSDPNRIIVARRHWFDDGNPRAYMVDTFRPTRNQFVGNHPARRDIVEFVADQNGEIKAAIELELGQTMEESSLQLHVNRHGEWIQLGLSESRKDLTVDALGISTDGRHLYFLSNHDQTENGTLGAFSYDFLSGSVDLIYRDSELDIHGGIYGHDGEILGVITRPGPITYTFFNLSSNYSEEVTLLQRLAVSFPGQDVRITSFDRTGRYATVAVSSDRNPGEFFLFDTEVMQARFLGASLPSVNSENLNRTEFVRVEASDGVVLHNLVTRPSNEDKAYPLIVWIEGDPVEPYAANWDFDPVAQFFSLNGYAFMRINNRGSLGRGAHFYQLGQGEWAGKRQQDIVDSVAWAVQSGFANPDKICIAGMGYGGYAAFMGLVQTPDVFKCGIGVAGVYDLPWLKSGDGSAFALLARQHRKVRRLYDALMASTFPQSQQALRAASPVNLADRLDRKFLIIHGENDVRVPVGHSERLRDSLERAGKEFEWYLVEGLGDGLGLAEERRRVAQKMLEFVDGQIGLR